VAEDVKPTGMRLHRIRDSREVMWCAFDRWRVWCVDDSKAGSDEYKSDLSLGRSFSSRRSSTKRDAGRTSVLRYASRARACGCAYVLRARVCVSVSVRMCCLEVHGFIEHTLICHCGSSSDTGAALTVTTSLPTASRTSQSGTDDEPDQAVLSLARSFSNMRKDALAPTQRYVHVTFAGLFAS